MASWNGVWRRCCRGSRGPRPRSGLRGPRRHLAANTRRTLRTSYRRIDDDHYRTYCCLTSIRYQTTYGKVAKVNRKRSEIIRYSYEIIMKISLTYCYVHSAFHNNACNQRIITRCTYHYSVSERTDTKNSAGSHGRENGVSQTEAKNR